MNVEWRGEWRTEAVEDFLKHVYLLAQQVDPVPTTLLARALNIAAPSVTDMIKRLSTPPDPERRDKRRESVIPQLLEYEPYRGVRLTEIGRRVALEVVRHHRLLELYLTQELGYTWDEVHDEADRLEHHISERLEARIADALGNPSLDPHGDPIPAYDGTITTRALTLLCDLPIGRPGEISRIIDQTPEVLRYLADLGLLIGTHVEVHAHAPLNDTLTISVSDEAKKHLVISTQVARKVLVLSDPNF